MQVISEYANIVMGREITMNYPEPARGVCNYLAVFSLQLLNFLPPECARTGSTFYHRLVISTLLPLVAPPFIWAYFACVKRDADANVKALGLSLAFFELVLSSVSTMTFRAFSCAEFDDGDGNVSYYLNEQLYLPCDDSPERRAWVLYSGIMVVIFPIGVPLLIFTVLFHIRREIAVAMTEVEVRSRTNSAAVKVTELLGEKSFLLHATAHLYEKFEHDAWW